MKITSLYVTIVIILNVTLVPNGFAQTQTENYIKTETVLVPRSNESDLDLLSNSEIRKTVTYFDALGKKMQIISIKISASEKDIVTPVEYDELGIQFRSNLAYQATSTDGSFRPNAISEQRNFYQSPPPGVASTNTPYAETVYQKSPLIPVLEQGAVGTPWQPGSNHTIQTTHLANDATDDIRIWVFDEVNHTAATTAAYSDDALFVTKTTDENGNLSYEYKEKTGKLILKKTYTDGVTEVLTYYIYDEFDNLRMILPPEAVDELKNNGWNMTNTIRDTWATYFVYDGYQRVVAKKIPEADSIFTIYDRLGRVVLTQDGNLRAQNRWMFTKYDVHGRTILTGVYTDPNGYDRAQMQAYLDQVIDGSNTPGHYAYYETPDANGAEGYTDNAFPPIGDCQ
ncbi:MAG: hypothetical protein D6748_04895, partial [Calditrichaeota bacterium]